MVAQGTCGIGGYGGYTNSTNQFVVFATTTASTALTTITTAGTGGWYQTGNTYPVAIQSRELESGREYDLPDGSILKIDALGNFQIDDSNAQVTYKSARIREFNPYINASDLLEDFIRDLGALGVRQSEVLQVPIKAFIHWLILQAAQRDGDSVEALPPVQAALPPAFAAPRCGACGRFIRHTWADAKVYFCSPAHMQRRLGLSGGPQ